MLNPKKKGKGLRPYFLDIERLTKKPVKWRHTPIVDCDVVCLKKVSINMIIIIVILILSFSLFLSLFLCLDSNHVATQLGTH